MDRITASHPFVAMLLANLSHDLEHPVYSQVVQGGTSVLSPPTGVKYRATVIAKAKSLVLELTFFAVEPEEASSFPRGPVPSPTLLTITPSGLVSASELSKKVAQNIRDFVPPPCTAQGASQ
jgi:hypothetical protein